MILIIDYRQNESKLLLADKSSVRRFADGDGGGFVQLSEVIDGLGKNPDIEGIAVVLIDRGDSSEENRMSWSTVRAAVSLANSLAFAWGVSAVRLDAAVEESELLSEARTALAEADPNARVSALYDGEPNITKPKAK